MRVAEGVGTGATGVLFCTTGVSCASAVPIKSKVHSTLSFCFTTHIQRYLVQRHGIQRPVVGQLLCVVHHAKITHLE